MSDFRSIIIECFAFLLLFAVAHMLTRPLRRAVTDHTCAEGGILPIARNLLGYLSLPLAVLVLSELLLWAFRFIPSIHQLLLQIPEHIKAWLSFWLIVLSIKLVEGIARQTYCSRGLPFPVPELLGSIIRSLLYLAAAFVVIRTVLDVDISPLLASTALLTAVAGFALQGVLSNLMAGMSLHITRSVLPFDWVAIDNIEGRVIETNWRETRLRTHSGHIMVVPNSTVANAVIHNMTRPTPLRRHSLPVGASYSDAPGDVIDALVQSALSVPEVLRDPPPDAQVTEFKDFGINYVLRYWTESFHERQTIDGAVARMVWYQFKRRGIEIPFPMSDKLLQDFMAVVFHQRRLAPEDEEINRRVADLQRSDFWTQTLVDGEGRSLLKDDDLRQVAEKMRRLRYTRGETLFYQGDPGDTCYVVVSGRLHGRMDYEGTERAVEFEVGPGALVGEMSLMTGLPRTATVSAREEVELLEIPQDAFACLLGLHPEIPTVLSRLVSDRVARNTAALEQLKNIASEDLAQTLQQENILRRFLRILGYGTGR